MKLYKKAAACLLTAAMAISMLTACGGGGNGGNGGNGGGNTPSPLPNNPDQIVLPDIDEGGEGTGTKPTKTPHYRCGQQQAGTVQQEIRRCYGVLC